MRKDKLTKTTEFLLPLTLLPSALFGIVSTNPLAYNLYNSKLFNSFLYDDELEEFRDYHVFTVHKNHQSKAYIDLQNELHKHLSFIDRYEICDSKYVVTVLQVANGYREDYSLLREGKYSKISEDALETMVSNNFGGQETAIRVRQVVTKSPVLKKALEEKVGLSIRDDEEVWGLFIPEEEVITKDHKKVLKGATFMPDKPFLQDS